MRELEELFAEANLRKPALGEFPGDERLHKEFQKKGEINAYYVSKIHNAPEAERERRRRLQDLGYSHNSLRTEEYKRNLRNKGTYVLPGLKQDRHKGRRAFLLRQEGGFTVVEEAPKKRDAVKLDRMMEQERLSTGGAEKKEHKRDKLKAPDVPQRSKTDKDLVQIKKKN